MRGLPQIQPEDVTGAFRKVVLLKAELPERDMTIDCIAGDMTQDEIWVENRAEALWVVPIPPEFHQWDVWSMHIVKRTLYITLATASEAKEA